MALLNRSTCRRIKSLRQIPSVWEGDRYPVYPSEGGAPAPAASDCIIWVDGVTQHIRAIEMADADSGPEAVVRVLLRAMEQPLNHSSQVGPARPSKIVVRDRELHFFLRGIVQDLDIAVDYVEDLPLIDDIVHSLQSFLGPKQPPVPEQYATVLNDAALDIWHHAPWHSLADDNIIAIHLNHWDIDTLYVSCLGQLGMEFGVLFYRSKDTLAAFRQSIPALDNFEAEDAETAFLQQDCLFLTFDVPDNPPALGSSRWSSASSASATPEFGILHPLEGMRPFLYDEEAEILTLALRSLSQFWTDHHSTLALGDFPSLTSTYAVESPAVESPEAVDDAAASPLSVTVETMPAFSAELRCMDPSTDGAGDGSDDFFFPKFQTDTFPKGTLSWVDVLAWEQILALRQTALMYQSSLMPMGEGGLPVVVIQTSRPKALALMERLEEMGGIQAVGFVPSDDVLTQMAYDLGLLQTRDGTFHIFAEYDTTAHHSEQRQWMSHCQKTQGYCGVIIAKGGTGKAKGNPSPNDMLALFEVRCLGGGQD